MNTHISTSAGLLIRLVILLGTMLLAPSVNAMSVEGELRVATPESSPRGGDPAIYRRYSGEASLLGDYANPRRASAFDVAGSGPQARITGISAFIIARERRVFDRIRVRVQFWNRHADTGNAVFAGAAVGGQVDINLVGPFILDEDTPYEVYADFIKPVQLDDYQSIGVTLQVLANANGGPIVEQDGLAIAYDVGSAPVIGVPLAHYRGATAAGGWNLNFGDGDLTAQAMALVLRGASTSHTQCSTQWSSSMNHFAEEFDGNIEAQWTISQNGGDPVQRVSGQLTMTAPLNPTFPYVRTRGQPIPATGEFSVRWLSRYTQTGGAGTGTLVVANGVPVNGQEDGISFRMLDNWQHNTSAPHYRIRAWTPGQVDVVTAGPGQHEFQDIEYCWLSDHIEVWVNGVQRLNVSNAGLQRPNALWTGNSVIAGANADWSHFVLYSVRVRKPYSDEIFGNGFE